MLTDKKGRVETVYADSPNAQVFRENDQVLTINGTPFSTSLPLYHGYTSADSIPYTVLRDGQTLTIQVQLVPATTGEQMRRAVDVVAGWFFWLVGATLFFTRTHERRSRVFLLMCLAAATALFPLSLSEARVLWASYLSKLGVIFAPAAFAHLHLLFPRPARSALRRKIAFTLYGLAWLLFAGYALPGIHTVVNLPWFGALVLAFDLYLVGCLLLGLFCLTHAWHVGDWHMRRQIRLIVAGTTVAIVMLLAVVAHNVIAGGAGATYYKLSVLSLILIPFSYAHALYKEDLMRSDLAIKRMAGYGLTWLLGVVVYFFLWSWVTGVLPESIRLNVVIFFIAIGLVFLLLPTSQLIKYRVLRLVSGISTAYWQVSSEVLALLTQALDHTVLVEVLTQLVPQAMQVQGAGVGLLHEGQIRWVGGSLRPSEEVTRLPAQLQQRLEQGQPLLLEAPDSHLLGTRDRARWVVPIRVGSVLEGIWLIGPQPGDQTFNTIDLQLLRVIAHIAALAVQVMAQMEMLKAQLSHIERNQQRLERAYYDLQVAREVERTQLAGDLHDHLLQRVYLLRIHTQMLRHGNLEGHERTESIALIDELTQGVIESLQAHCHDLRSRAGEICLELMLHSLTQERSVLYGFAVELDQPQGQRWAWDIERTVYGVVHEALNNIGKHAQASRVVIRVIPSEHELRVMVCDNGQGFDVEDARTSSGPNLGLTGMYNRASAMHGKLHVRSRPEVDGTEVSLILPLN